ncbi:MAG: S8 family serine peptidase [Deltaproteobacteria bacterium]|nr:S8 family serine peptidase [Deltaproteobacteria bacterium]
MKKNTKTRDHKYMRPIWVVFTGCLLLFISGMVTPSLGIEKMAVQIRHFNNTKIKTDLSSQKSIHKGLKPDIKDRKMGPGLNKYISKKVSGKALSGIEPDAVTAGQMVRLILKASNTTEDFSKRISLYGGRVLRKQKGIIIVEVPGTKVEEMIAEIEEIEYARQPFVFFPLGEVSEGVHLSGTDVFQDAGFGGSGVKVAIIDVGFKGLAEALLNGDIPSNVKTHDYSDMGLETMYFHGTACAEIIHDMAPHAELHLLKIYDEIDEYYAYDYCVDNNIDIISMSLGTFGTGPGDGTGPLDEAFDDLRQKGIFSVSSAGNQAVRDLGEVSIGGHWEGIFIDSNNDDMHEFLTDDSSSFYNIIAAYPDQDDDGNPLTNELTIVMRWNDWPNADVDYDLFLHEVDDETGRIDSSPLADSDLIQDGSQCPVEIIVEDIPDSEDYLHYYALIIEKTSDAPSGIELELYLGGRSNFIPFYPYTSPIATSSSSITEPADAGSVFAVGAIEYTNWVTGPPESFSSQGPTNAWAESNARVKPDIMGPDGVSGYTLGDSPFLGTSAAAPHVAGAAALILSIDPDLSPDELQSFFESNAVDMGVAGKDNQYGWGRMNLSISDIWLQIGGEIQTQGNAPLCAMVLANGQHMFTCGASNGLYDLKVPLDENGRITLHGFCSGFAPFKTILTPEEASVYDITMTRAAAGSREMEINVEAEPSTVKAKWVRISGTVYYDGTPLCAMVLANGQRMFSGGVDLGAFDLDIPLDKNGEINLHVFCSGFAPYKTVFAPIY